MMKFMNRMHRQLPLALGLALAACDREPNRASIADSVLSRDLTLAAAPTPTPAAPSIGDTATNAPEPVAPRQSAAPSPASAPPTVARRTPSAPAAPAAAPTPAPEPAATVSPEALRMMQQPGGMERVPSAGSGELANPELPFGTVIVGQSTAAICAKANRPGDRLVITTTAAAYGPSGALVPAGSKIVVEMTAPEAGAEFSFRTISVEVDSAMHPLYGTVRTQAAAPPLEERTTTNETKSGVLGNAMRGALLGRILGGGSKGALIGAATGVAAGTIAARRNAIKEHCLPAGVSLSVILSAPLALGKGAP